MRTIPVSSHSPSFSFIVSTTLLAAVFCTLMLGGLAQGQDSAQAASVARPLITQPVDESQLTTLKGNVHPLARPQYDLGTAPASLPMERMLLVLKRSAEQETALRKLLDDQQDKDSPNYHKWLTPEQFGKQFGPTDGDMQIIIGWLQSHGFQVGSTKGRTVLEFSGSASQVQEALHTSIHKYVVNGEQHWANASDPQIPTALTPAVAGVLTLHNFLKKPQYILAKEKGIITPGKHPQINFSDGSHGLVPGDYAVIYNINPVYNATPAITGTGITIGVVGRSDIEFSDVSSFQSLFSPSSNTPNNVVNGADPGDVPGDDIEGTLDVTWSQTIAPGATVDFVVSASTDTADGVDLSEFYIIENNLANIMTESFSSCEAGAGDAQVAGTAGLAEQAAAQGISYMVATGDAGAEGCDSRNGETVATGPISVSLTASSPFTVGVGGTVFNDSGGTYWSATNGPDLVSALSYIPEDVWNDSCPASSCGSNNANIAAGGGGESLGNGPSGGTFTGFPLPSWQSGVTGISGTQRLLPDVSLTAAPYDGYALCFQGSCSGGSPEVYVIGGTSASTPSFAGIMALVDQKMGTVEGTSGTRQGQADYVLYPLAAAGNGNLSNCNGSKTTALPASTCTFNDVTVGNNEVPGEPGYPNAPYNSTVGYDPASGLGSVNVANLVKNWASATFRPTTTTLTLTPTTGITHGQSVTVNITVARNSGTGTPTGDVSLIASVGGSNGGPSSVDGFTLSSSGTFSGTTNQLPGGTSYTVTAHYAGNSTSTPTGTFAPGDSNAVTMSVGAESSTTTLICAPGTTVLTGCGLTFDSGGNLVALNNSASIPYGDLVYLHASVAGTSGFGIPTGTVSFNDTSAISGNPYPLTADDSTSPPTGSAVTPIGLYNLPGGSHSITAKYNSDPSFDPSTSPALAFTITPAATAAAVSTSATSIVSGGSVTLTANLTLGTAALPSFGNPPSGTVSFYSNGTLIGSPQAASGAAGSGNVITGTFTLATGTASLTTTALPNGSDTITAVYNGDGNYAASAASPGVVVTVGPTPDFSLPSGGLGTVIVTSPGGTGTVNLSITATNGFSAAVNFTCVATSLPTETTCGAGTIAAGASAGTMMVQTTGPHQVALQRGQGPYYVAWLTMGGGLALGGVFLVGAPRRRRWTALMFLMMLALVITLPACGGGSGSSTHTDPGTPVGMTTVTVNATSGSLSHSTTFVLNVQ